MKPRKEIKANGFDGKIHERQAAIVLCLIVTICAGLLLIFRPTVLLAEIIAGLFLGGLGGYLATPDLDHEWTTMEEYRALRWDKLLGKIWIMLWQPYARTFEHRSKWTHSWRGSLIRAIPFMLLLVLSYLLLRHELHLTIRYASPFYPSFLAAWLFQDAFHYRQDGLGWLGVNE